MDIFWKFATVIVAIVGAYIAAQQFWLASEKLKLDLFEKRFAVFAAARHFLSRVAQFAGVRMDDFGQYRTAVAEASFLFEEEVVAFLDEIDRRALHLWAIEEERKGSEVERTRERLATEVRAELDWLTSQLSMLKPTFEPYLKFEEWHWIPWRRWTWWRWISWRPRE
jgi:hypothetical protein